MNKTRKLEFLIPDAIKNKTEIVVTVGAVQSNHARQTAAACTLMGLKCLIILEQRLKNPPDAYMNSGNIFLDKLFGAEIKICPRSENVEEYTSKVLEDLKSKGTNVYFIPGGGSSPIGALGYVECLNEIIRENNKYNFTQIVHATGSSATQAGLIKQGQKVQTEQPSTHQNMVRMYSEHVFLGLGELLLDGKLVPKRIFNLDADIVSALEL